MNDPSTDLPICRKHGEPKSLWRDGRARLLRWTCRHCHAEQQRWHRARQRVRQAKGHVSRILSLRLSAERLDEEVKSLIRLLGGGEGLRDALPATVLLRLGIRCSEAANEAFRTAEELECQAEVELGNKRLQAELDRMALAYAHGKPSVVAGVLSPEMITSLRRKGWTIQPPDRSIA